VGWASQVLSAQFLSLLFFVSPFLFVFYFLHILLLSLASLLLRHRLPRLGVWKGSARLASPRPTAFETQLMCGTLLEYVDSKLCGQIKNLSGGLEVASSEFSLDDLPLCSWK